MRKQIDNNTPVLEAQDQKDFEKYLKYLSLKTVQVIVQSRLGEKKHTRSRPTAMGQDWFNLAIDDMQEITNETKKAMGGGLPSPDKPMCVEISLTSSEGESMVLETWCLGMNNRQDSHAKITFTVYNRMGMLLKSLIAVTRVTPAYRLARKQGGDYLICYRVYFGDVRIKELGEGFQTAHVGSVGTPVGSVTLSAAYRTRLAMSQSQPVMPVKSDHYSAQDYAMKGPGGSWENPVPCAQGMQTHINLEADVRHIAEEITSAFETEVLPGNGRSPSKYTTNRRSPTPLKSSSTQRPACSLAKGAFAGSPVFSDMPVSPALSATPPFASLLCDRHSLGSDTPDGNGRRSRSSSSSQRKDSSSDTAETRPSPSSVTPSLWGDDDFVLVELKPAFASPSSIDGDLGSFYRECQAAPPLTMFQDTREQTLGNIMEDLDQQLTSYHQCLPIFDELVANLQQSSPSS